MKRQISLGFNISLKNLKKWWPDIYIHYLRIKNKTGCTFEEYKREYFNK
jgi:hypothetical protein